MQPRVDLSIKMVEEGSIPEEAMFYFRRVKDRLIGSNPIASDAIISFRGSDKTIRSNRVLLGLISDEWWKVFFSNSGFTSCTGLNFEQDEEGLFCKLLEFYTGDRVHFTGIYELLCFGNFSESHLAEIAAKHAETEILKVLDLETCGICMSMEHGLAKVKDGCRKLALYNFDWFITTKGFRYLTVENLMDLLGDTRLLSESVETIQKAVKAANFKNISIELETVLNDYASIKRRNMLEIQWDTETSMNLVVMSKAPSPVCSMIVHGGDLFCGLEDGNILKEPCVTDAVEHQVHAQHTWVKLLPGPGHNSSVFALASHGRQLISADKDHVLVWNVLSRDCELEGEFNHDSRNQEIQDEPTYVMSLAVNRDTLIIGYWNSTFSIWSMEGKPSDWVLRRSIQSQAMIVSSWGNNVATVSDEFIINIWEIETGQFKHGLTGHETTICALQVLSSKKLVSADVIGTVNVWEMNQVSLKWNSVSKCDLEQRFSVVMLGAQIICWPQKNRRFLQSSEEQYNEDLDSGTVNDISEEHISTQNMQVYSEKLEHIFTLPHVQVVDTLISWNGSVFGAVRDEILRLS